MFLQLKHTQLDVFKNSRTLVLACYKITKQFPGDEKFAMVSQIRRAALSVHLNIAEGCSRKSNSERNRFFEISRGSVIKIDTAFNIAVELGYINIEELQQQGVLIVRTFKMLTGIISNIHN